MAKVNSSDGGSRLCLIQDDDWTPTRSRRARVRRKDEAFGPYAEAWLQYRISSHAPAISTDACWTG